MGADQMNTQLPTFLRPTAVPLLCLTLAVLLAACARTEVTRLDPDEQVDLTDRWNATDSRLVSEAMIEDMLTFPWIDRFRSENPDRERPRVIIQSVRNRSHEHIPVDTFINDLRRELIRAGRVDLCLRRRRARGPSRGTPRSGVLCRRGNPRADGA
jgi:hypothetical protein